MIGAYSGTMRRHVQSMTPLLWVIAFALLIVRTADAHMHLCFDGQEPRSSFHVLDREAACHEKDGPTDSHQDVDALGAALAKKGTQAETVGPLPTTDGLLLLLPPQRGTDHEITTQNPAPKLSELFLPPLRGPPV